MSLIQVQDLSYTYPGALYPVFQNVSLDLDTSWRLGLVGRNGRGKTTFLKLLLGELKGTGNIVSSEDFEYFPVPQRDEATSALTVARGIIAPFDEWERRMRQLAEDAGEAAMQEYGEIEERYSATDGYQIDEEIAAESGKLGVHPSVLQRPYETLSGGERVKLQLAALFLKKHSFLLIDEPTDHLDAEGRSTVAKWLAGKSGFILVSHDRRFLDEAVDHILSINRADIELQKGNYSSWRNNRTMRDEFEKAENKKLESSIGRLKEAAARTEKWSDKVEGSKKGGRAKPTEGGRISVDRGYLGHQAAKMMQRSKSIERRRDKEIEEKQALLKNLEETEPVRFLVLPSDKKRLLAADGLSLTLGGRVLFQGLSFAVEAGERLALTGPNGGGKSSLLRLITGELAPMAGTLWRAGGLVISAVPQDTTFLRGDLRAFSAEMGLEDKLFLALLRKLDFERGAFEQDMATYSAGQKKKVCLAASLAKPAHIFVWDEPLNYIDVLSREQIEEAVHSCGPSMVFVEHDAAFCAAVATKSLALADEP